MNNTKHAILITLYSILVKGKIHYCTPRPHSIIELLNKFHDIDIRRRWFFQCTHDLEAAGYLARHRRWEKLPGPEVRSAPSMFALTVRAFKYLRKKGVRGAEAMLKPMYKWLHRGDNRPPSVKDLLRGETVTDREGAIRKIREIIESIGQRPAGGIDPARA